VIKDVIYGDGHYLKHEQTIALMETEFLYPNLANRKTTQEWEAAGKETIFDVAHQRLQEMMRDYYPQYIPAKTDAKIRENFPIKITEQDMKKNDRW